MVHQDWGICLARNNLDWQLNYLFQTMDDTIIIRFRRVPKVVEEEPLKFSFYHQTSVNTYRSLSWIKELTEQPLLVASDLTIFEDLPRSHERVLRMRMIPIQRRIKMDQMVCNLKLQKAHKYDLRIDNCRYWLTTERWYLTTFQTWRFCLDSEAD